MVLFVLREQRAEGKLEKQKLFFLYQFPGGKNKAPLSEININTLLITMLLATFSS